MARYTVDYEADYEERRNRLTTFFRLLLVLPHALLMAVLSIAYVVVVVLAWFAIVFTGRLPAGMYGFITGFLRLGTQVAAYAMLVTDRFPPFSLSAGDHPVRVVAPPAPKDRYDRLRAGFRFLLVIPWAIVSQAYMYVAYLAAIGSWFAIVFTGRQPPVLQKGLHMGLSAQLHYTAYGSLVAEEWPPFEPELRLEPRAQLPAGPEAPSLTAV
ncbi:MAG TPA: DUF4389 domain-containing protein [Baekduia sp.]|nr:DUF4389 domain-containing protein [Baekduia sp.]